MRTSADTVEVLPDTGTGTGIGRAVATTDSLLPNAGR